MNDFSLEFSRNNIESLLNGISEADEQENMEIYHLKTDIAAFLKEISVYKADNDKLLNEIKNLMLSESDVFTEAYETLEKDLETSEKILNDFQEIDKKIAENFELKLQLLKKTQENEQLISKKLQEEEEFSAVKLQISELQRIYDSYFPLIDEENIEREQKVLLLSQEISVQNQEIEKFKLEKQRLIEEYESKINLKNIRYELEMDDYLRSKNMRFGTEIKPKTIIKTKLSDMKIIKEECKSKTMLKYE